MFKSDGNVIHFSAPKGGSTPRSSHIRHKWKLVLAQAADGNGHCELWILACETLSFFYNVLTY